MKNAVARLVQLWNEDRLSSEDADRAIEALACGADQLVEKLEELERELVQIGADIPHTSETSKHIFRVFDAARKAGGLAN